MKTITLTAAFIFCMCNTPVLAQQQASKKPGSFSFNVSLSDYNFCKTVRDSSFAKAMRQKDWLKTSNKSFGIGIAYWRGLTRHIDFSGTLSGTLSNFPAFFVKGDSIGQAGLSTQLDALLHFRLLKDNAAINPFLTGGIGIGYFSKQAAAYAPVGAGLQFRFSQGSFLVVQAQWRKALMNGITNDYMMYSIGFVDGPKTNKRSKKQAPKKERPVLKEVPKKEVHALTPFADADKDGISDEEDKCPNLAGTKENNGCPVIKAEIKQKVDMAVKQIFFDFASDAILEKSFTALDQVVAVLKQDRNIKIKIEAHSDNRGTFERNMYWSQQRAKAVADYFITKGIAAGRIQFKGYGDTRPVADNGTEEGRSKNRRVEIKLNY
jgi:outer membrane protein OmpA-like peptidoglycan-associated protein